ncbi:MAG: peptidase MA family metallohydrolase [Anaerolineales bacterium]
MRCVLHSLLLCGLILGLAPSAQAQSDVVIEDVGVTYLYGEEIIFSARLRAAVPIQAAYLIFQAEGDPIARVVPLTIAGDGTVAYTHHITAGLLRPFAVVTFWFRLELSGAQVYTSPPYNFKYEDNRPPWQTLQDDQIRLHWYTGDTPFGQAAFDTAHRGLQSVADLLPVNPAHPIDIYIYPTAADVQQTLGLGGESWVAGHADPALGVLLVSIAPGEAQNIEMERQIPHELAHILLYQYTGSAYENLPTWLIEGLATQAELYPNADYNYILSVASQNDTLIPIANLCGPFPADVSGAMLAYAQSGSFVGYLRQTYGASGLHALLDAYADGLDCERGAMRALGLPLSQLDLRWRQAVLGEDVASVAWQNLAPYFILLALMLAIPLWRIGARREKGQDVRPKR